MPLNKKGNEVMASMHKTYGSDKKAKQVFYASVNSGKLKGVEGSKHSNKRAMQRFR